MLKTTIHFFLIFLLLGCTQNSNNTNEMVDSTHKTENPSMIEKVVSDKVIKNDKEFFELAEKITLPCSFNTSDANNYFLALQDKNLPLLNERNIIDDTEKKDIYAILKKHYGSQHDFSQYFENMETAVYRMAGVIEVPERQFVSKIIYYQAETKEGIHVNLLLMVNMDKNMETYLNNAVLAIEIGVEAGASHFIKLSSELNSDEKDNIIIKQKYQVEDTSKVLESSALDIVVNTCTYCEGDKKKFIEYQKK